jgi:hypothetical protein
VTDEPGAAIRSFFLGEADTTIIHSSFFSFPSLFLPSPPSALAPGARSFGSGFASAQDDTGEDFACA